MLNEAASSASLHRSRVSPSKCQAFPHFHYLDTESFYDTAAFEVIEAAIKKPERHKVFGFEPPTRIELVLSLERAAS